MRKIENIEIALIFNEIGDYLELQGENSFKIRAYRNAARVINKLPDDLNNIATQGKLTEINGIGRELALKISEILDTGKLAYLEKLKETTPKAVKDLMSIPGIGAKTANRLYQELHISTMEELEKAAKSHKIKNLPGMGSKVEQNVQRGIRMLQKGVGSLAPIGIALAIAEGFLAYLRGLPGVVRAEAAGSTRRFKEMIGDIDLVVSSTDPETIIDLFVKHPQVRDILSQGDTKASVVTLIGVQVDLLVVQPEEFYSAWHHFTGNKDHNIRLRGISHEKQLKINEYGVFKQDTEEKLPVTSEEDIYTHLGLPYIPPEIREDTGEIEAAQNNSLPQLLRLEDIRGDLHMHSEWSDGVSTITQMVEQARSRGYSYIAITDHSKSLGIARGLSLEKLWQQRDIIRELDSKYDDFHILWGLEVDILSSGEMDYADEIMGEMDIVIGSVHSGFKQDEEKLTNRIISAIKNKEVDIIAHPTGRLLGRRDPYAVNMDRVLEAAAEYNTVLEINSSPDRLDINDVYARKAKEMGIKIAINTDAHDIQRLGDMYYGVSMARRGWLEKKDVINCMEYHELMDFLKSHKKAKTAKA